MKKNELDKYPFEIRTLKKEEGGGFLITYPDFNECVSDGETIEEAIENGRDALKGLIQTLKELGKPVPKPYSADKYKEIDASGKFVLRLTRSLHAKLIKLAKKENVSMNFLAASLIAEGIGKKE
jgi:antitoxin HicB